MNHKILYAVDRNSLKEKFAVVANMIDWKDAFPRQCHELGVKSFISNGVRGPLIPILINYFQDRKMSVKHHGVQSVPRSLNGGGPQGATLGLLEYLSQSNNNAKSVPDDEKFKFIDDLTILDIVNLLTILLPSYNIKKHVPSHIPNHNQYISAANLKAQGDLNEINDWTLKQKMKVNESKCKTMIFNFNHKYQFTTNLSINNIDIQVIEEAKLLGVILSNDLRWEKNTEYIIKKANSRMELLRRASRFCSNKEELKTIYIAFIRSVLEFSSNVWHTCLTLENSNDLERVQKCALKIILKNQYIDYQYAFKEL